MHKNNDCTGFRLDRYFGSLLTSEKLNVMGPGKVFVDTLEADVIKDLSAQRKGL